MQWKDQGLLENNVRTRSAPSEDWKHRNTANIWKYDTNLKHMESFIKIN